MAVAMFVTGLTKEELQRMGHDFLGRGIRKAIHPLPGVLCRCDEVGGNPRTISMAKTMPIGNHCNGEKFVDVFTIGMATFSSETSSSAAWSIFYQEAPRLIDR